MTGDTCPFCVNPKKSRWYYDGSIYVVADDVGKPDTIILFPHKHVKQEWLLKRKEEVVELLTGISNALWGREARKVFDWVNRQYEHAHVQLKKIG